MSTQVSQQGAPAMTRDDNEIIRRTANYHESIWGDQFVSHLPKDNKVIARNKDNTIYIYMILCHFFLPLRNLITHLIW